MPRQQRFGQYTRSLIKALDVPVHNKWGLRPAIVEGTNEIAPLTGFRDLDAPRLLTMPTVLVRAMKPLNGALIVPDRAVDALVATNPKVRVVETPESNHFTCIIDPITLAAMREILS